MIEKIKKELQESSNKFKTINKLLDAEISKGASFDSAIVKYLYRELEEASSNFEDTLDYNNNIILGKFNK